LTRRSRSVLSSHVYVTSGTHEYDLVAVNYRSASDWDVTCCSECGKKPRLQ
jgi:hypothetical protein